jgi:hypothetical protein
VCLSDDQAAIDAKFNEVTEEIAAKQEAGKKALSDPGKARGKRTSTANNKKNSNPSQATERQIARALGQRAPAPSDLQASQKAKKKALADEKKCRTLGQNSLDSQVMSNQVTNDQVVNDQVMMSTSRRILFPPGNSVSGASSAGKLIFFT